MDIVHTRCEGDDRPTINPDGNVMPAIFKKFLGQVRVNGVIEQVGCDVHQNALITATQNLDFNGHW